MAHFRLGTEGCNGRAAHSEVGRTEGKRQRMLTLPKAENCLLRALLCLRTEGQREEEEGVTRTWQQLWLRGRGVKHARPWPEREGTRGTDLPTSLHLPSLRSPPSATPNPPQGGHGWCNLENSVFLTTGQGGKGWTLHLEWQTTSAQPQHNPQKGTSAIMTKYHYSNLSSVFT